ncbi:MarR family winged helix-turn-helix transcriptional regulator [Alkalibacillus haloalkaliphilus]|uniref:MarR family winged helix-turn-helix transcriptional regulator n=1 Tax=Alkalibacillus haloalkaliphilus TaxID=94136 RepID=UPI002935AFAB|nr:MarR family transcriptional regulator [Alkalibacillus haloalkaliphilus]MDV2581153.1 MarR family transcriptional regulator [Alkalibacillus haloalkaliphilus]
MHSTIDLKVIAELEKDVRYISHMVKQRGREILNHYPITPPQFIALQWLLDSGDLTIGELSKKMYLAFSTTTDLVDRMEKNVLIERVRDPKDRRVVRIHLLDKGKEIIDEVIEKRQEYLQEVLKTYSPEEVEKLRSSMTQLYNEMKEHEEAQEKDSKKES